MKEHAAILAIVIPAIACLGCGTLEVPCPAPAEPAHPVLVVGLDGATWDLVDRFIDGGALPEFARLKREGACGVLQSFGLEGREPLSPIVWTTIATGRTPEDHGIRGFVKSEGQVPYTNSDRRCRAVWNILSHCGLPSSVVGWFTSWPVDRIEGAMICDRCTAPVRGGYDPPNLRELLERTAREFSEERAREEIGAALGPALDPATLDARSQRRLRFLEDSLAQAYRTDVLRLRWTLELIRSRRTPFTAVFFKGIDVVSHQAWLDMEPDRFPPRFRPPEAMRRRLEVAILRYYEFMDRALTELVAATPTGTQLVVVSDHGFGPGSADAADPVYRLNVLSAALGWVRTDPQGRIDAGSSLLLDPSTYWRETRRDRRLVLNRRLAFKDAPTPEDRRTRVREIRRRLAALATVEGTPVFASVRPGSGEEDCLLRDGECFLEVNLHVDLGALARSSAEDAPVRIRDGQTQLEIRGFLGLRIGQSGTHRDDGLILMAGPTVRGGHTIVDAGVYDVAPTVLRLLGFPAARDMPGRVLEGSLHADRLPPVGARVATYETGDPVPILRVDPGDDLEEEAEKLRGRLRGLGYID